MNFFIIFIIILAVIACILGFTNFYKKYEYNKDIEEKNNLLKEIYNSYTQDIKNIQQQIENKSQELNRLKTIEDNQEEIARQSFTNYCNILDNEYKEKEEEYNKLLVELEYAYDAKYDELAATIAQINIDLDKIKQTRAAAMEAQRKEKEIEENFQFYSISIDAKDRNDIQTLERVKKDLNNPRILSMLIWTTFFRDKITELCNNVLGTKTIIGIYKITNQETKECYIGQSVDIAKRWKDHAKCGLDIDRPQGNKLYQNMIEYGLWNFTFELLEECPREQLNEKEKFYISLYDSCNYGFNSNKGVDKNA